MCRSIKVLRYEGHRAASDEIEAAALQFARKISGYRKPSQRNAEAFNAAVDEITATAERLLAGLETSRAHA